MSASTPERLAYMANQIAANLALDSDPVKATSEHIASFWTMAMRGTLRDHGYATLLPIAREAMERLDRAATQTPTPHGEHEHAATDPAHQGSDAG